ncbi:hypothetical protein ACWKWC_18435 [Geodermatophilus nigrescens]
MEALAAELGAGALDPLLTRRNVVLRGAEVEALRGETFSLDCGEGVVVLRGGRPANPCAWLDTVLAPGAHRGLRGRAGVRCAPLTGGVLRLGPAVLRSAVPLDPARAGEPRRLQLHRPAPPGTDRRASSTSARPAGEEGPPARQASSMRERTGGSSGRATTASP